MHYRNQINLLIDPLGIEEAKIAKNTKTLNHCPTLALIQMSEMLHYKIGAAGCNITSA